MAFCKRSLIKLGIGDGEIDRKALILEMIQRRELNFRLAPHSEFERLAGDGFEPPLGTADIRTHGRHGHRVQWVFRYRSRGGGGRA